MAPKHFSEIKTLITLRQGNRNVEPKGRQNKRQSSLTFLLSFKVICMRNPKNKLGKGGPDDQMKAGTERVSTQSWSLKPEQGHVLALLKSGILRGICAHMAKVVFDLEP